MRPVALSPKKYVGQVIVFPNCAVNEHLEKTASPLLYGIGVTSGNGDGNYYTPVLTREEVTFVVSKKMAEALAKTFDPARELVACTMVCKLDVVADDLGEYPVAHVLEIKNVSGHFWLDPAATENLPRAKDR